MKKIFFLAFIYSATIYAQISTYSTNIAITTGNWRDCSTWNNPVKIHNTKNDFKTINDGVIVTQNISNIASNKIVLRGNAKINFIGQNKISFIDAFPPLVDCNLIIFDNVMVNFAEPVFAKSLVGFLQGLGGVPDWGQNETNNFPTRESIKLLQPKMFRQFNRNKYFESYTLSSTPTSPGRVHMIVGAEFQLKAAKENWGSVTPNMDWSRYDTILDNYFLWGYNNGNPLPGIVWECWNEPDTELSWHTGSYDWGSACMYENPSCFPGDETKNYWPLVLRTQFFETYKYFYTKLKSSVLGNNAKIAGPSIGYFNKNYLKEFFDYCLLNNLQVNVVSWHEINYPDRTKPFPKIKEHVDYVRDNFMNNPTYAALKIETIEINELVAQIDKNNPAAILAYLGYLEQSNVDYACKSCWGKKIENTNVDARDSCRDNSLNDLYTVNYKKNANGSIAFFNGEPILIDTINPNKPKSSWWAYKLYADGVNSRVKSFNEDGNSIVLASKNINFAFPLQPQAQVLFGYNKSTVTSYLPDFGNYNIRLNSLNSISNGQYFKITIKKVPYRDILNLNGEIIEDDNQELTEPEFVSENIYIKDAQGGITFNFPDAEKENLYQMIIKQSSKIEFDLIPENKSRQFKVNLNISPNPSRGIFKINFEDEFKATTKITLYNSLGEKLMEQDVNLYNNYELDLTTYPPGVYLVNFSNKTQSLTKKVVKK